MHSPWQLHLSLPTSHTSFTNGLTVNRGYLACLGAIVVEGVTTKSPECYLIACSSAHACVFVSFVCVAWLAKLQVQRVTGGALLMTFLMCAVVSSNWCSDDIVRVNPSR